ncbi:MAG: hypothetical protein JST19_16915 [Bacteroidetes bacterium]|nr:hypothetical protein [Bacteroidota bacterium]
MKKIAVFCLATFYLLLTTGMFVCIVHCSAQWFLERPALALAHHDSHAQHHHKGCGKDKDCDCCKKHGSYAVKENIKPALDFPFTPVAKIDYRVDLRDITFREPVIINSSWTDSNAPPAASGKDISIRFCSLLI